MKSRVPITAVILFAAALATAQGGAIARRVRLDVPPLLIRAIRAQPNLRYTGTYTVEFRPEAKGATSMRHQEYITRDGARYRIDFPSGSQFSGQVIVEDDNVRYHYQPKSNEILQQPPRHGEAWEKVANLARNPKFQLSAGPGETIAGIRTEQLVVSDKAGNVVQRRFMDPGSGVIMKRQIFDAVGTQIGYFEFNQIDLSPNIDGSSFTIKRAGASVITPITQLNRISRRRDFLFTYLSPGTGFKLESANFKQFAGVPGIVQTYVNGKVRLWMYQLKAPVDPGRLRQLGKNVSFFSWQTNGETIVLMGNVAERDLERFSTMMASGSTSPSSK